MIQSSSSPLSKAELAIYKAKKAVSQLGSNQAISIDTTPDELASSGVLRTESAYKVPVYVKAVGKVYKVVDGEMVEENSALPESGVVVIELSGTQLSAISYQQSAISYQPSAISKNKKLTADS